MLPFPVKYGDESLPDPARAPTVGEHNEAVLSEVLGYDADRIASLRKADALG
jgi:crotonobetainyl-CoA:carnitine CoA-transferase CaiB-like acyl-CoA transferase